ncbi:hypothetical protein PWT90_05670 [Aphanocladium album]|nr:hypothetical protein PWT90_05670 [Aphanocladium album]
MAGKQFIEFYYNQFDSDRNSLASLYRDQSMLTFESASVLGVKDIVEKLTSLPFEKVKHQVSTLDAQPGMIEGSVVILVTGQLLVSHQDPELRKAPIEATQVLTKLLLQVDEEQRPMNYTQAFQLAQENGQYFVFNDVFKLVYG